jgi:hypothetical protein
MLNRDTVISPRPAASVTVAYTGTAGTSAASPAGCQGCYVLCTTDAFIEITPTGVAAVANTGLYLPAFIPFVFASPGEPNNTSTFKVSAIQVSAGGSLYVSWV